MKILILSNYFTPDFSAGSFRIQALVDALEAQRNDELQVDIITTVPNRYANARAEAAAYEDRGWLRIHRITLPTHSNGLADQARAYLSYVLGVRRVTKGKRWDLVFATSSRLMTAGLGAHVARRSKSLLYLDIRDLFTLNMRELFVRNPVRLLLPLFQVIERNAMRRAVRLNVVSEGFITHIRSVAPRAEIRCFTNGIDQIFLSEDFSKRNPRSGLPLIVYAGNIGDGQGLHRIIPQVASLLERKARLRVIGDGGKRRALEEAIAAAGAKNVELLPPVSREQLIAHYCEADILFLHLNELEAFHKVLPSKLFEYAATGRPMMAGVSGHAAEFLALHLPDVEIFKPLDAVGMVEAANRLIAANEPSHERILFRKSFARREIMRQMAADVLALASSSTGR